MARRLATGLLLLVIAGCGGTPAEEGPESAGGRASGKQAEEKVLDDLGRETKRPDTPLKYCDGRPVRVRYVRGEEAIDTWRAVRNAQSAWPLLIGSPEDASVLAEMVRFNCEEGHAFRKTLRDASKVETDRALAKVARRYGVKARDLRGSPPLPDHPAQDQFVVPFDLVTEKPLPEVGIALLPVKEGWQAPAILPWGNYNDNPGPAVHTAVLRRWSRRYGAELVSMTGETIEMSVARPPDTDTEALALAGEQFRYAPDIVQQGTGDVETLAATLKDGNAWYFWWD